MSLILLGYIFTFFHITINGFDLLADFIGFILIYRGLSKFPDVQSFKKAKPWTIVMVVISFLDIFPFMSFVGILISIYIMYRIVDGIEELEKSMKLNLNSKKISLVWTLHVILTIITYLMMFVFSELTGILAIVVIIVDIVFLVCLYEAEKILDFNAKKDSYQYYDYRND